MQAHSLSLVLLLITVPTPRVAVSSTVRIAVAAGLHLEDPSSVRTSMQLPPADQFEMYERKKLWHSIHMLDLTVASVCGSAFQAPSTVSRSSVWTETNFTLTEG